MSSCGWGMGWWGSMMFWPLLWFLAIGFLGLLILLLLTGGRSRHRQDDMS